MKCSFYTSCFLLTIIFFGSCNKTVVYEQNAKTLDSLGGAVNSMLKELQNVDTLILQKSVTRYNQYKQFIDQNVNDTINKEQADNLQRFFGSGKNLENFSLNRKLILSRAVLINSQLEKLAGDIQARTLSAEQVSDFSLYEKKEAGKFIESGYQQQKLFHASLEEFKNALRGVELLIRSRNKGELPTIVKDTVSL